MKVGYIIVHYHSIPDTLSIVSDLEKNKLSKNISQNIYLVDNAQDPKLADQIKAFKTVTFIKSPSNLGFAAGNNLGLKQAIKDDCNYLVLINNDTIAPQDLTEKIINSPLSQKEVGAVGGLIYFASGFEFENKYSSKDIGNVIWYAGGIFDWDNVYASHRGVNDVDHGQYFKTEPTDFITGCLFATKKEVIEKIGLLDENYCMYLEDSDWGMRIKKSGLKLIFDPNIKIWHKVAQSSGIGSPLNDYFLTRNRLLFGLTYARSRTKFALIREAFRKLFSGTHAQKIAIRDFFTHNWGKGSWLK